MSNLTETEKKEMLRLLFVSIMHEADRMNLQGIENAIYLIKKMNDSQKNDEIKSVVTEE
jgi:hypothetical protein